MVVSFIYVIALLTLPIPVACRPSYVTIAGRSIIIPLQGSSQ